MKTIFRMISLIIAAWLLLTPLASCAPNNDNPTTDTPEQEENDMTPEQVEQEFLQLGF